VITGCAGIKGPLFDPGSWSPAPVQMSQSLNAYRRGNFRSGLNGTPSTGVKLIQVSEFASLHLGRRSLAVCVWGQTAAPLWFEVASIKSSGPLRLRPGQSIGMRTAWPASSVAAKKYYSVFYANLTLWIRFPCQLVFRLEYEPLL